jgi:hypothetical protein
VRSLTDAPSEPNISGTCGLAQRHAAAAAFFFRPLLCRASPRLTRSFLILPIPTSRFRAHVLGPNDGRGASFDLTLCLRSALWAPRHLLRPCHAFFPIPFDLVNICASFASPCRDSLQFSILMPNIMSQSILSPAKNTFLSSSSHHLLDSSSSYPLPFPSGHF